MCECAYVKVVVGGVRYVVGNYDDGDLVARGRILNTIRVPSA